MSRVQVEVFFSAVDTLYFRGSRPHSAAGASTLPSDFPPSASTLSGTVRTRLGDALGVDWQALKRSDGEPSGQLFQGIDVAELLGSSADTGLLDFAEVRLYQNKQRLYPVPAVILKTQEGELVRLAVGDAVKTDLGYVHLPQLPQNAAGAKPLEGSWLTEKGLNAFLKGGIPSIKDVVSEPQILQYESRLGIGRDTSTATVESGLLYQTEHLRLADGIEFSMVVSMPEAAAEKLLADIQDNPVQRFGGEGRMAYLTAQKRTEAAEELGAVNKTRWLLLLTDMLPEADFHSSPLPGFTKTMHEGVEVWEGEINGVALRLLSVISGKAKRYGGWDIRNNKPREVQSYVPAGSCFYVEPLDNSADISAINGVQIGRRKDFGYGTLVCAQ